MLVIPVIDILNGVVVRGVGGRRDEYCPLPTGSDPLTVAAMLRSRCGHSTLYLADLDAIDREKQHHGLYRALMSAGGNQVVDAGVRDGAEAIAVADTGATVIAGLETVLDETTLCTIVESLSPER